MKRENLNLASIFVFYELKFILKCLKDDIEEKSVYPYILVMLIALLNE